MSEIWSFSLLFSPFFFTLRQELFLPTHGRHLKHRYWMIVGYYELSDGIDGYRLSIAFAFWRTWKGMILLSTRGEPKYTSPLVGDFTWLEALLITWNSVPTPACAERWSPMLGMACVVFSLWGWKNTAAYPFLGLWDYNPRLPTQHWVCSDTFDSVIYDGKILSSDDNGIYSIGMLLYLSLWTPAIWNYLINHQWSRAKSILTPNS